MKNIISFGLFMTIIVACIAQHDSSLNTLTPASSSEKNPTTEMSESDAYKMLYENQVKSNSEILKTIYYALGGLGTAVLLVFASNWWFNEKKVKDTTLGIYTQISEAKNSILNETVEKMNQFVIEKNSEINQTLKSLQKDVTTSTVELTSKFSELSEKARVEIREDNKALTSAFEDRLKSYSENFSMQLKTLEKLLNERSDNLNSKVLSTETRLNQNFDKKIESIEAKWKHEMNSAKRVQHFTAAELAVLNKEYSKAFRNWLEVALSELELGWTLSFTTLNYLAESLKKAEYIWEDEETNLRNVIQKIEDFDDLKKAIIDDLQSKKIQKFGTTKKVETI